jgi:ABC-type multidrug transport system fused ATPase/permease subunit
VGCKAAFTAFFFSTQKTICFGEAIVKIPFGQYLDLLADPIRSHKGRFVLLAVLVLGSTALQVVNPQIVRTSIDAAASGSGGEKLISAALAFLGVALLQQVVGVSASYVGENLAWMTVNALRVELNRHCLRLDMRFHNEYTPGELIERIDGDVGQLADFFAQVGVGTLSTLLLLLGVLVALFLDDWRLGVAFSLFAAVSLLALNRVRDIAVPHHKARRQAEADLYGFLEEQLAGTEDIRSSGAIGFCIRQLYPLQYTIMHHARQASLMNAAIDLVTSALMVSGNVMAVVAGYYLFTGGIVTVGTVYLIIYYFSLIAWQIHEMTWQFESMQTVGASVERLIELRQTQSALEDGPGAEIPAGPLPLTFDHVSFAYVTEEPVLKDLSFQLGPGKTLGLLGRTGSGKTTLARLVFRLYDPTDGQIALNGVNVRQPKLKALRERVAIVTQDVQLFQASVRDNLTFFDRSISDERIWAVIEELKLVDWYQSLPGGLDTQLETGGQGLSAGEAQLLAFTRVFLRDPGLVILDEASSRLDPVTERRIECAIDALLEGRTAIVIAHRLDTVHRADEIMILEEGGMREYGERERLAVDPHSRFYSLLQTGLEEMLA